MIKSIIESYVNTHKIPGLSFCAHTKKNGLYEYNIGYADLENEKKVVSDTVFEIGSLTKVFTSTAILRLIEMKQLTLDARISNYFKNSPKCWEHINIQHLLTHSSGLCNYTDTPYFKEVRGRDKSTTGFINFIMNTQTEFQPGEKIAYSNTGYYILGLIIEKITHNTFINFIQKEVIKENLSNIFPHISLAAVENKTTGYKMSAHKLKSTTYYDPILTYAAGMLAATTKGLVTWLDLLFSNNIILKKTLK
ncbi:MAG TPA: serine hydrolase domain-containing protein, partial [Legionellaceae bacterium]|nr:serine hydrolase domain-containing protein [Legionellaceae bacterium]